MIRAGRVCKNGDWQGLPADVVVLDYESRHRRRIAMKGLAGTPFLMDLPQAVVLADGDALVLDDGRLIEIRGALEDVAEIKCHDLHDLLRLSWHLGNRHVRVQTTEECIRMRRDHVIEAMAQRLGAEVLHTAAPFSPDPAERSHLPSRAAGG